MIYDRNTKLTDGSNHMESDQMNWDIKFAFLSYHQNTTKSDSQILVDKLSCKCSVHITRI